MWVLGSGTPDLKIVQPMPLTAEPSFQHPTEFPLPLLFLDLRLIVCVYSCACLHVWAHVLMCMEAR